ncbi:MAG: SEC-C domain-containing protein, partial [Clostridia bacterium]|nr:SEC-C domain-containing protein [Clostridia bacterium]
DVMNQQRKIIYKQRDEVLDEADLKESILTMLDETVDQAVELYLPGDEAENWDIQGLCGRFLGWITDENELDSIEVDKAAITAYLKEKGRGLYEAREEEFSPEVMRNLERMILLRNVDIQWMDHIDAMEQLQDSIGLRAYAQQDPVVAYKYQGSDMFNEMTAAIREDTVHDMLTVRLKKEAPIKRKSVAKITSTSGADEAENGGTRQPVKKAEHPGPNDPCWCGSGKKYKKCHMMQDIQEGKV